MAYNKCCILERYFDTKLCQAKQRMIINIYDKGVFYIVSDVFKNMTISISLRLYKPNLGLWNVKSK